MTGLQSVCRGTIPVFGGSLGCLSSLDLPLVTLPGPLEFSLHMHRGGDSRGSVQSVHAAFGGSPSVAPSFSGCL